MTSSNPNYLPKAPSANTIVLRVRASTQEFEGTQFSPQQWPFSRACPDEKGKDPDLSEAVGGRVCADVDSRGQETPG